MIEKLHWHPVTDSASVHAAPLAVRLLDEDLVLWRDLQGALHAWADRCPHRGAPICAGRVVTPIEVRDGRLDLGDRVSVLRCPWHKWEFEIATGRCLVDERLRLRR